METGTGGLLRRLEVKPVGVGSRLGGGHWAWRPRLRPDFKRWRTQPEDSLIKRTVDL